MGASTNAPMIMSIFAFYGFIAVMMGLIGGTVVYDLSKPEAPTTNPLTIFEYVTFFFRGLAFSIEELGVVGNTLLFLPVIITLAYIIFSGVRGSS